MNTRDIRFATPTAPRHQLVLYAQSVEEMIPADAPVRQLVALFEEVNWGPWEQAYAGFGQPPIHPRYLAAAIVLGLMNRVRSSRELERAACKHLDFIWLLEGFAPDHSTFANFRVLHAGAIRDLQRQIAEKLVRRRATALLELIVDGTRLRADSDRHGARSAKTIEVIIKELERRLEEMKRNDGDTLPQTGCFEGLEAPGEETDKVAWVNQQIARLEKQREKYEKARDIARQRDQRAKERSGQNARPVRVPVTDPEAQIAPNKEGGYAPNYTPVAAIDVETGAIVHADVLEGSDEASAVLPAVEAAKELTGQTPSAVLSDGNFAAGEVLAALDAQGIEAYMPTRSASPPDNPALRPDPTAPVAEEDKARLPRHGGVFARAAFAYDAAADLYHCPAGKVVIPRIHSQTKAGVANVHYQCDACSSCPWIRDCIKGKAIRRNIVRDAYEPLREATDARMATEAGQAIYKKRAPGIEGVFACIKSCMGIRRFTRRGLEKVRCDWNWICTAYNLKKLLAKVAKDAGRAPKNSPQGAILSHPWSNLRLLSALGAYCVRIIRNHKSRPVCQVPQRGRQSWKFGIA